MKEAKARGGMAIWVILFLLMLILKLTVATSVSWFWVFFPLAIPIAVIFFAMFWIVAFGCVIIGVATLMAAIDHIAER